MSREIMHVVPSVTLITISFRMTAARIVAVIFTGTLRTEVTIMPVSELEQTVTDAQVWLDYCQGRLAANNVAARRRAVRRASARLVKAELALGNEWGEVEDDNAACANCGQGYDSDVRDTCPSCLYGYRYEKCRGSCR